MSKKIYVDVIAKFSKDGIMRPIAIIWEDGSQYEIQKVLDIRPSASLKAGGCGMRYTVRIDNQERYLFLEEDKWFVEGK